MNRSKCSALIPRAAALIVAGGCCIAFAQTPQPNAPSTAPVAPQQAASPAAPPATTIPSASATAGSTLGDLAWLRGCWAGKVAQFDYVESWLAERGGMMVGINQTVVQDRKQGGNPGAVKTQEYQYLRLEQRPDGVYYVAIPSGKKETAFKLTSVGEELGRKAYSFTNPADQFPKQIVYMRGKEGWLYAKVAGEVAKQPKEVVYPMQHVDCVTGALLPE
jgi:hypothetical protein